QHSNDVAEGGCRASADSVLGGYVEFILSRSKAGNGSGGLRSRHGQVRHASRRSVGEESVYGEAADGLRVAASPAYGCRASAARCRNIDGCSRRSRGCVFYQPPVALIDSNFAKGVIANKELFIGWIIGVGRQTEGVLESSSIELCCHLSCRLDAGYVKA